MPHGSIVFTESIQTFFSTVFWCIAVVKEFPLQAPLHPLPWPALIFRYLWEHGHARAHTREGFVPSDIRKPVAFLTSEGRRALIFALFEGPLRLRRRRMSGRGWVVLLSSRRSHGIHVGLAAAIARTSAHSRGRARLRGHVAGILERLDHGLLLALLLEAGLAVGIDAALGDDIGSGAGWMRVRNAGGTLMGESLAYRHRGSPIPACQ